MTNPADTVRELATHAADIRHLQTDMDRMVESVEDIKGTLETISRTLAEARGGWRMLVGVGGAGGALGAAAAHFLDRILK